MKYIIQYSKGNKQEGFLEINIDRGLTKDILNTKKPEILYVTLIKGHTHGEPIFVYYNNIDHYDGMALQEGYTAREILYNLLQEELQNEMREYARSVAPVIKFSNVVSPSSNNANVLPMASSTIRNNINDKLDVAMRFIKENKFT